MPEPADRGAIPIPAPNRWLVLLNYNTASLCLENADRLASIDAAICIVDNASPAEDRAAVTHGVESRGGAILGAEDPEAARALMQRAATGTKLFLVQSNRNLGFGAGNNVGLRLLLEGCGDALRVIVLNPDVTLEPAAAIALLEGDDEISGPAVHEDYIGGLRQHLNAFDFSTGFDDVPRWRDPAATGTWLSGCCLAMSGVGLRRFGLFPEETFLYAEEMYFFGRVLSAGGRPRYRNDIVVRHAGSVSTGKRSFNYYYYIFRNQWLYYHRIGRRLFRPRLRFYWLYLDWVWGAARTARRRGSWEGVRGILVGMWHGMRGIDGPIQR